MLYYSPGMAMRRDFGPETCKHCGAPFTKVNKRQFTCGKIPCRDAQNLKKNRERVAAMKALRLEAARLLESAGAA